MSDELRPFYVEVEVDGRIVQHTLPDAWTSLPMSHVAQAEAFDVAVDHAHDDADEIVIRARRRQK